MEKAEFNNLFELATSLQVENIKLVSELLSNVFLTDSQAMQLVWAITDKLLEQAQSLELELVICTIKKQLKRYKQNGFIQQNFKKSR